MSRKERYPQQDQHQSQKKKSQKKDSDLKNYARYSGIAFQMIIIIGVMTYLGVKLDERAETDTPVYTAVLSLLGVLAALYIVLRDFIRKD